VTKQGDPALWRAFQRGLVMATTITVVVVVAVLLWKKLWVNPAPRNHVSDASIVIGTFITLYGLFIGGFGVLTGLVTSAKTPHVPKIVAIILLVEAAGLDLFQVLSSTTDLFAAATTGLTFYELNDDVHDFLAYFLINTFVASAAVVVAAVGPRYRGPTPGQGPAARTPT
jgi:hypothetical protein